MRARALTRREGTPAPEARAARNTQPGARSELREQHARIVVVFRDKARPSGRYRRVSACVSLRRSSISYTRSMEFRDLVKPQFTDLQSLKDVQHIGI